MHSHLWLGSVLVLVACSSGGTASIPGSNSDDGGPSDQHTQTPPAGSDASVPGPDAGPDASCVTVSVYVDSDGDGYGAGPAIDVCAPAGSGYATVAGDCDDSDGLVFPGQTTPQPGAKDYDCSGEPVPEITKTMQCNASGAGCNGGAGSNTNFWLGTVPPDCGETGTWVVRCKHIGGGVCEPETEQRTQRCL